MRIVVLIIALVILAGCSRKTGRIEHLKNELVSVSGVLQETQAAYRRVYSLRLDRFKLDVPIITTSLDTCTLNDVIDNSDCLYFHYSDEYCTDCLQQQLHMLKDFQDLHGPESLCICVSAYSVRPMAALIRNYKFTCQIVTLLHRESIFRNTKYISEPFYFTVDDDFEIDLLHFPVVQDSVTTRLFLKQGQTFLENLNK